MPTRAEVRKFRPYTDLELSAITAQLKDTYADAERRVLAILQGDITDWSRAFRTQQLAQIRAIYGQLNNEVQQWAELHLPTLYRRGMWSADGYLQPGGLSKAAHPGEWTPMDLGMTRLHKASVQILGENMALKLGEATSFAGQRLEDMISRAALIAELEAAPSGVAVGMAGQLAIRDASLQSLAQAFTEGQTRKQASKTFVGALSDRGITSFVDKAGREWSMSAYSEMVARTVSQETQRHGTQNRLMEAGHDLVEVSSHGADDDECGPWEGEILSLTGETDGYPTVADAIATGLFHPNCKHALLPHIRRNAA